MSTQMPRTLCAVMIALFATTAAFAQSPINPSRSGNIVTPVPPEVAKEFTPTGKLRAAINLSNIVLVQKDASGAPKGITPDLAHELAKRLGVPIELVIF